MPLIVGLAFVLIMGIVVVVDASAAYLQRQGLDTLADGAALRGADLGSVGTYEKGIPADRLDQLETQVDRAVAAYLKDSGAYEKYPGIRATSDVNETDAKVTVQLSAPLKLPLTIPGSPDEPEIAATGTAAVTVLR
ncbi:Tad domain-containing protein [Nocardioides sp. InS609-2]|uniref:Tad domain-containing protein n=1 Tax=Nocardioides sp. InS609-2 TaxID=2760705 RepID=UPI0024A71D3C|nr:Tad domain-containing protein [Nocardioides sp. InS609-2]